MHIGNLCNFDNSNDVGCQPSEERFEQFENGKEKFRVGGVCNDGENPQADGTCRDGTPVAAVLPNWIKACKDGSHPQEPLNPDGNGDVYTWCEDGSEPKCADANLSVDPVSGKCGTTNDAPVCPDNVNTFDTPCKDEAPQIPGSTAQASKEAYWQKKNNANNNSNGHYYVIYPHSSYDNSNYYSNGYSNRNENAAYYYLSALIMFFIFFGLLMQIIRKAGKK